MAKTDANSIFREIGPDGLRDAIDRAPAEFLQSPDDYRGVARPRREAKFVLERWRDMTFDGREEWLIKRILPRRGLAAIYGKPGAFKSFVAQHIGLCVASEREWAGRRVSNAPVVYVAGEGAAGVRKRREGYVKAWPSLPPDVDFALIPAAPNLGADPGDLPQLVEAIERARMRPGLIVIDTAAQSLGQADENGAGMTALIVNAEELAQHFDCLVLFVHHVGLADDKRLRGHTSLGGALDAQILCERREGENCAVLTLQKLKDDVCDVHLRARLERVVVGRDEDGEEISTLIVVAVEDAQAPASAKQATQIPASSLLLMDVLAQAIDEAGEALRPFGKDGPLVRGVADHVLRARYYARLAEKDDPADDPAKAAQRRRQAFSRAIKSGLDAKRLVAADRNGTRFLWTP
jgi:hypothetical protein